MQRCILHFSLWNVRRLLTSSDGKELPYAVAISCEHLMKMLRMSRLEATKPCHCKPLNRITTSNNSSLSSICLNAFPTLHTSSTLQAQLMTVQMYTADWEVIHDRYHAAAFRLHQLHLLSGMSTCTLLKIPKTKQYDWLNDVYDSD